LTRTLTYLLAGAVALSATTAATAAPARSVRHASPLAHVVRAAKKQPVQPGFYEGKTVRYFDFGPIKLQPGNKLAPIWVFTNGAGGQRNIIDTVPGEKDYTPLWQVNQVTWADGKTPRVLKSADEVKQAAADGELAVKQTATVVNCPVLGFAQKRNPGFSAGHTIFYYDLGPVKVAPGNAVVPLYTVTNGVAAQHNIARDTIAPGQTAYPPLWAIAKVTWNSGTTPRLLKSYCQIKQAQTAGQVSVQKTTLVVNCPLV
jgi:hypothetical protein